MDAALPASAGPRDVSIQVNPGLGIEREVAVLFADLRAFTRLSEGRLPYDVVFVLNRYFRATGEAIEAQGGRVDKFIGDAIMALFGIDQDPQSACRQELCGRARDGVRAGAAQRGARPRPARTAAHPHRPARRAGDPRRHGLWPGQLPHRGRRHGQRRRALEAVAKEFEVQLVASSRLAERAGIELGGFEERRIEIRGRRRPLRVRLVPDARALPLELGAAGAPALPAFAQLLSHGRRALHLDR